MRVQGRLETGNGYKNIDFRVGEDEFVKLFMDPKIELKVSDISYLIGYKMVYVVDAYRERIPNVIAIVTMKIPSSRNAIYQSEGRHSKKDNYEMIRLSKRIESNRYYTRDEQADSLRHTGGNMLAWEHSTKYCAYQVETLALTFCGKFKDVIRACKVYDENLAFAESAFTHEENQVPVVYEVGVSNVSKYERPAISTGKCLDFFHFFMRPEYALDYGFWQFQYADRRSDVNRTEIVLGKKFDGLRKVNYRDCDGSSNKCERTGIKFVKTDKGYRSSQLFR